ncbi:transglycosylase, partial [Klebsiella pneumoniae]|uniref:transglycosylase n=1 Tax=Klebsiella pneumoniae TaxID=573 RepID=UPI0022705F33
YLRAAEHFRVPQELLWAVTQTESGANLNGRHLQWPWTLNIKGTGYRYARLEQACQALLAAIRLIIPKRIDVVLGQINIGWHRAYFDSPCDDLHPLQNLSLTARLLRKRYDERPGSLLN